MGKKSWVLWSTPGICISLYDCEYILLIYLLYQKTKNDYVPWNLSQFLNGTDIHSTNDVNYSTD